MQAVSRELDDHNQDLDGKFTPTILDYNYIKLNNYNILAWGCIFFNESH